MKILILGAQGMLGSALAREFVWDQPTLWDRKELDITDESQVREKLLALKPEYILNAAAFTDVDEAEDNPEAASLLNAKAVGFLAASAKVLDAVLVQFSTAYVFRGDNIEGYDEDARPDPVSVYGQSKLDGERAAQKTRKHYIIRLDRLFGKAGSGKKSFVEKIMERAKGGGALKVIDAEEGNPTYAPDFARFTRMILHKNLPFGIYHGANSGSCTWMGFAEEIFKIKGIPVELEPVPASYYPRKAKRPDYSILLNTKTEPQRAWQEALHEFLNSNF